MLLLLRNRGAGQTGGASLDVSVEIITAGTATIFGASSLAATFGVDSAGALLRRGAASLQVTFGGDITSIASRSGAAGLEVSFNSSTGDTYRLLSTIAEDTGLELVVLSEQQRY